MKFTILVISCVFGATIISSPGRTLVWQGSAGNLWSNSSNWWVYLSYPNVYAAPADGDNLFLSGSSMNDLANLTVGNVVCDYGTVVNGNALTVTNGITSDTQGSGTVTFNCPLAFQGDQKILADPYFGEYTENTAYLHFNGPVTVASGTTLIVQANGTTYFGGGNSRIYFSGPISGAGNIWAREFNVAWTTDPPPDDCSIEFNGADDNSFTGYLRLTTIANSQIIFNKTAGHAVNSRVEVLAGENANLQSSGANQIGGGTDLRVQDGSTLHFSGNDITAGSITMQNTASDTNASTLDTGAVLLNLNSGGISSYSDANVTPLIRGKLNFTTYLPVDVYGSIGPALEIQAPIQGAGFQKLGGATLILSAANGFNDILDVDAGALDVRNAGALGTTNWAAYLTGTGSMTLRNVAITNKMLIANGTGNVVPNVNGSLLFTVGNCSWTGPILLDSNLVVWADNTILSGQIYGDGALAFLNGTATISGASANTFTGGIIAQCELLQLNKPSGTKAYNGPLVVGGGIGGPYEVRWLQPYQNVYATLTLYSNAVVNLNNHNEDFGAVTFNGGEVDTGTGQFAIYQPLTVNPSSAVATINGYLGLPAGDSRYFNVADGPADPDLQVNAVMFGSPTYFVKQGSGSMRLANANTFGAVTLHEGGTLDLLNASGISSAPCVIFDGATLRLNFSGSMANNFEAVGNGVGGTSGAFQVPGVNSVSLNGSILLDTNTLFNVAPGAALSLNGAITGSGPLNVTGGGVLSLGGGSANTYSGLTTINAGVLYLGKSGGAIAVPGNLVLGPAPSSSSATAIFLSPNSIGGNAVTINANSSMNLNGRVQTLSQLNLNDGGSVATGTGTLYLNGGSTVTVGSQNLFGLLAGASISGNIGLPPNNFAISFNVGAYGPLFVPAAPELDVSANIFITSYEDPNYAPTRVYKTGFGRMRLTGNNSYKGGSIVNVGILQVDGTHAGGVTVNSGTLDGTGTVGPIAMTSGSAVVSPGHSPGILTCSNFNSGGGAGIFKVELNGTNAGTDYSQLNVNGTVNLNNLALSATLGFASSTNDQFTIINNDGTDPITGTFKGLPAGAQFYIGGQLFQISYGGLGRLGNDVVLTRLTTPFVPMLSIQQSPPDSVRLSWATNDPAFALQSNTNLTAASWSAVSQKPVVIGTNNVVTNTAGGTQKFYRLSKP